jgi:hypothetical protein
MDAAAAKKRIEPLQRKLEELNEIHVRGGELTEKEALDVIKTINALKEDALGSSIYRNYHQEFEKIAKRRITEIRRAQQQSRAAAAPRAAAPKSSGNLQQAQLFSQSAADAERAGKYQEAYALHQKAVDIMLKEVEGMPDNTEKGIIMSQIKIYMNRIRQIKSMLQTHTSQPAPQPVPQPAPQPVPQSAPLPDNWEIKYTPEGITYYVDHDTQKTYWDRPVGSSGEVGGGRRLKRKRTMRRKKTQRRKKTHRRKKTKKRKKSKKHKKTKKRKRSTRR